MVNRVESVVVPAYLTIGTRLIPGNMVEPPIVDGEIIATSCARLHVITNTGALSSSEPFPAASAG